VQGNPPADKQLQTVFDQPGLNFDEAGSENDNFVLEFCVLVCGCAGVQGMFK
jgi:hypothetical protein